MIYFALVVAVLIAALLVFAATRPDTMHVERMTRIKAPPEKIFPLINDFKSWSGWSPYDKKDPAMKKSYSGAVSGKGAVYDWNGNKNVGKGRMEIIETSAPSRILIALHFITPFEAHNTATFTLESQSDTTTVIWALDGASPFISKLMGVFVNMDKMIGDDFQIGLDNLKVLAEK